MARRPVQFRTEVPDGDNRERNICDWCGFIDYVNPMIVVGVVAVWEDRILLCRRAIGPREGYWTIPAGYMEEGETTAEGAYREGVEESGARLEVGSLLGMYEIPHISQVQVHYHATLLGPELDPGEESLEAALFTWEEIPWDELAFPSVCWVLKCWKQQRDGEADGPFHAREPDDLRLDERCR